MLHQSGFMNQYQSPGLGKLESKELPYRQFNTLLAGLFTKAVYNIHKVHDLLFCHVVQSSRGYPVVMHATRWQTSTVSTFASWERYNVHVRWLTRSVYSFPDLHVLLLMLDSRHGHGQFVDHLFQLVLVSWRVIFIFLKGKEEKEKQYLKRQHSSNKILLKWSASCSLDFSFKYNKWQHMQTEVQSKKCFCSFGCHDVSSGPWYTTCTRRWPASLVLI